MTFKFVSSDLIGKKLETGDHKSDDKKSFML